MNELSVRRVRVTTEMDQVQKVHECEREFMDTLKIIVESGYSLTQEDFLSLLDELEIQSRVHSVH
jgi:hypothetical protein